MYQYTSLLCQVKAEDAIRRLLPTALMDLLGLSEDLPHAVTLQENAISTHTFVGKSGSARLAFDGIRLVIECRCGDRLIFRGALRDRQLDATPLQSPLTAFPNSDPACNRLAHPQLLTAELSIYSWHPDYFLNDIEVPGTLGHFVADPDHYIWRHFKASTFFPLLSQAMRLNRAPWQRSLPIPGAARHFVTRAATLLTKLGYHRADEVPSWFNVVDFFKRLGYRFTYGEHAAAYDRIVESLGKFSVLTAQQQAWLVALQNLPESLLPPALRLGVRWPVTHTNQYWARMHLNLNEPPAADWVDTFATEVAEQLIVAIADKRSWEAWMARRHS